MYIEIRVQWTINFGSSHMRVHACDTEACTTLKGLGTLLIVVHFPTLCTFFISGI